MLHKHDNADTGTSTGGYRIFSNHWDCSFKANIRHQKGCDFVYN